MRISDWSSDVCSSDLIGVGADKAGPAVILSFGIAGLICACAALAYAEMATMIPASGSAYTYSRSEEHTSELQSLMRISYAVFCLKKKTHKSAHLIPDHTSYYIRKNPI